MKKLTRKMLVALLLAATLAACSPENGRARGGGPGGMSDNLPAGGVTPRSKVFNSEDPG